LVLPSSAVDGDGVGVDAGTQAPPIQKASMERHPCAPSDGEHAPPIHGASMERTPQSAATGGEAMPKRKSGEWKPATC
jgi:hypothetical protein